jgi:hypothetical protein
MEQQANFEGWAIVEHDAEMKIRVDRLLGLVNA